MKKLIAIALTISVLAVNGYGYGARGHRLVGAIAERRLAKNKKVRNKIRALLDGLTLEQVATLPDQIKSWDACGGKTPDNSPVTNRRRINRELRAFFNANLCSSNPSHGEFHYTNIPIVGNELYADGQVGRREFDIVHMIPFCIRVLRGDIPETNERKITKAVAIILITHYVGDIHQPLHVGAQFFDTDGKPFQPSTTDPGFADQGGNKLTLFTLLGGPTSREQGNLHGYWDEQTVKTAFAGVSDVSAAQSLATKTPVDWKLNGDIESWSEQMANLMMPVSREAHNRLQYLAIQSEAGKQDIISGRAQETKTGRANYTAWSAATVKEQIHKGGWRLAALFEQAVR